jgi:serine/threonine protein kinase
MTIPLTEVVGVHEGTEIFRETLRPGEYMIAREGDVAILLPSGKVSRQHALLTLTYFDWIIEDLGSSNGTRVGGKKISGSSMIFPTQDVRVGDVDLYLRRVAAEADDEAPAPQTEALLRYLPPELRGPSKYKVHGLLANGGMGAVLEAEDLSTRRRVAMKVLLTVGTTEDMARFIEEAQVTAQLEHPNIVPVYELNVNELDKPFYVMKLVRGDSLTRVLDDLLRDVPGAHERYPIGELLGVFQKVCDAIAFAHSKGVVHRDLKPDNIMLGEFGETMVMDWGLAKPLGQSANADLGKASVRTMVQSLRSDEPGAIGTLEGAAIGTPKYMSPEQADGRSHVVDSRTDVYALGAILYSILTLQPPVDGEHAMEIMEKVVNGRLTPPEEAVRLHPPRHLPEGKLPTGLIATAMKALSLDPASRFVSVREFQAALHEAPAEERPRSRFGLDGLFRGRK